MNDELYSSYSASGELARRWCFLYYYSLSQSTPTWKIDGDAIVGYVKLQTCLSLSDQNLYSVQREACPSQNGVMFPAAYCSYIVCPVMHSLTMFPRIPNIAARPLLISAFNFRAFSSGFRFCPNQPTP
jgi:hypothetical protein